MGCTHSKRSLPSPPPSTASPYLPRNSSSSSLPATRFIHLTQPNRVTTAIQYPTIDNDSPHLARRMNNQPAEDEDAERLSEQGGSDEERRARLRVKRSSGRGVGDKMGRRRPGQSIENAGVAVAAPGTG